MASTCVSKPSNSTSAPEGACAAAHAQAKRSRNALQKPG
eukprot:CAMPEP_0179209434 /NCGR_PEP_ID=MMETSP0796-20121207/104451_1 /TAXON_ID=73915 /ORGANISM="Pyrodinium bahamense, Strain pbaha01" /LENGTH=38 /DNA_ID= /DNA_START= /DNA_END= /DNA_ORIENTATION=